jgi:hypothetical protein
MVRSYDAMRTRESQSGFGARSVRNGLTYISARHFSNPSGAENGYDISGYPVLFSSHEARYFPCVRETDSLGRSFLPGRRRKAAGWKFDSNPQVVRSLATIDAPKIWGTCAGSVRQGRSADSDCANVLCTRDIEPNETAPPAGRVPVGGRNATAGARLWRLR